jgi:hypothetical protein
VTEAQVRDAARKYFAKENRTVGIYHRKKGPPEGAPAGKEGGAR